MPNNHCSQEAMKKITIDLSQAKYKRVEADIASTYNGHI